MGKCDCGAVKCNTKHYDWCSSLKVDTKVHVGIDYGFDNDIGDAMRYAMGNTINSQGHISKAPQVNVAPTFSSPIYAAITPFSVGDKVTHFPTGQACIITAVQFSNGQHTYDAALISDPSVTGNGLAASDLSLIKPKVLHPTTTAPSLAFSVGDMVYHKPSGDYCIVIHKVISNSAGTLYDIALSMNTAKVYYSVPSVDLVVPNTLLHALASTNP
jgi:hypothetical protein